MKKFLKVFSVLAVICCSLFVFTGCTITLSEEQKQKVMTVVDNADVFMEDVLENLDKSNSKLGREESFLLLKEARNKLFLNHNKVWNNLKITTTWDYDLGKDDKVTTHNIYTTQDETYIDYYTHKVGETENYGIVYEDVKHGCISTVTFNGTGFERVYQPFNVVLGEIDFAALDLNLENVLSAKQLDNGNINISLVKDIVDEFDNDLTITRVAIIEVEITLDAKIMKYSFITGTLDSSVNYTDFDNNPAEKGCTYEDEINNPYGQVTIFEYGIVDGAELELKYNEAKEYVAEHESN